MGSRLPMIDSSRKRRILLVGAGRRVQNNFLPALTCLRDIFDVRGIHSRTYAKLALVADKWGVLAVASLGEFDFSDVDVVAISVPTSANAAILNQLKVHAPALDVIIDTPVASTLQEHAEISPLLQHFRSVTVAEDYMNFPRFALVRETVRRGTIGELTSVTLLNIGYLYHGLALIRSFVGFARPRNVWSHHISASAVVVGYDFEGGFSASIVGPYRRHTTGGILVEGTKGIITEYLIDKDFVARGRETYVLSKMMTEGNLSGFEMCGGKFRTSVDLPFMSAMRSMDIGDKSDLNLERGCGLIEVFRSLADFRNINVSYTAEDALYDSFVSRRAESQEYPLYPFEPSPKRPVIWRATADTFLKSTKVPALALSDSEKIFVAKDMLIGAQMSSESGDYIALSGVSINGSAVPVREWFIFKDHWVSG